MKTIHNWSNFRINHFKKIDSTNSYLLQQAKINQASEFDLIVADEQTSGRGRNNRKWHSYSKNLHFSFLLKPKIAINKICQLSFLSTIALGNVIDNLSNQVQKNINISYKWPNDLLINNQKIAGILIEGNLIQNDYQFLVVGIGVNINKNPLDTIFPATNLAEHQIVIDKMEFLRLFLEQFSLLYQSWLDFGFAILRKIWIKKAFKYGEYLQLTIDNQKIEGIFKDIDEIGNLLLEQNNIIKIINFAEIL